MSYCQSCADLLRQVEQAEQARDTAFGVRDLAVQMRETVEVKCQQAERQVQELESRGAAGVPPESGPAGSTASGNELMRDMPVRESEPRKRSLSVGEDALACAEWVSQTKASNPGYWTDERILVLLFAHRHNIMASIENALAPEWDVATRAVKETGNAGWTHVAWEAIGMMRDALDALSPLVGEAPAQPVESPSPSGDPDPLTVLRQSLDQIVGYVQHKSECEMLKPAPWVAPVMRDGVMQGISALGHRERAEIEARRVCTCGLSAILSSIPDNKDKAKT